MTKTSYRSRLARRLRHEFRTRDVFRYVRPLRIGIADDSLPGPGNVSGSGRVWAEAVRGISRQRLWSVDPSVDVVFFNAHGGIPSGRPQGRRSIAVAYEAGWIVPGAYAGYPPTYLEEIDRRTGEGVRWADHVIVSSTSAKNEIMEAYGVPPARIEVVPLGVDLATFVANDQRHAGLRSDVVAIFNDKPYVLYVNSFAPRKNFMVLREAVALLLAEGFDVNFVVVATMPGHLRDAFPSYEADATAPLSGFPDRLIHLKNLDDGDVGALMSHAAVFCAPSLHEGFGLTVLEAMAVGARVVVGDGGSLPELVGNAGLVVRTTVEDVAAGL